MLMAFLPLTSAISGNVRDVSARFLWICYVTSYECPDGWRKGMQPEVGLQCSSLTTRAISHGRPAQTHPKQRFGHRESIPLGALVAAAGVVPSPPIAPGCVAWQIPSWKLGWLESLGREMATASLLAVATGLAVALLALAWTWSGGWHSSTCRFSLTCSKGVIIAKPMMSL